MLRDRKILLDTKNIVLNCYIITILLYNGSGCWIVSLQMKKRFKGTETWFYRRILIMLWVEHVSNEEVLSEMGLKRILTLRKRQISGMNNKERGIGEFGTHRAY